MAGMKDKSQEASVVGAKGAGGTGTIADVLRTK